MTIILNSEFNAYIKNKSETIKKYKRILKALDRDILNGITTSGEVFWIESCDAPEYVRQEVIRWGEKILGLKYLYRYV